jgi:hypothetical protein
MVNCDEFKSEGLQEKLAMVTLILGKYPIIGTTTQENLEHQRVSRWPVAGHAGAYCQPVCTAANKR